MNPIMISSSQADQDFLGLVDSGADTSIIGPKNFIEVQHDHRRVSLEVLETHPILTGTMRIGNGITALDLEDQTVLIRVNEAVISPYKTIISTSQV